MPENNNRVIIKLRHGTNAPKESEIENYEPFILGKEVTIQGSPSIQYYFCVKINNEIHSCALSKTLSWTIENIEN